MNAVMPLEADTRLLIDRSLENLGWVLSGKDKNVFFEQPRTEREQSQLEGKRPDYVLYSQENHTPLIVIEAKRRGSRIDTALEQGIFYAEKLNAPLVFATDGVFCKAYHTFEHKTPLLNGEELDEFIREALALKYLNQSEINTVSPKVQYDRKELIKIFDNANNMLRGDGLRAGIERFGEFANILFIKLLSEKGNVDYSCSWDAIKNIPESTRIDYINSTVCKTLNKIYNTEIFTPLTMRDNSILTEIMDNLDPLTLTDIDSDVKGDAFEYFLKASTASGNDLGEYFTPRHIVKTMVRLVNPQIGEKVYDPFCGTGGFLIESFRYIHNNMPRNEFTEKTLRENTIFGNEITNTARITKMNMILAGDGHSGIHKKDSLANPVEGLYDIVLANMPYSQKTKHGNLYDIPTKNGDSVCVQHCMKAINATSENGRMALVVPEGFLFRKDLAKTREYLLERSELQSIISLPQGVFLPYTGVKTDIIFATKVNQKIPKSQKRKNYWYFDVKSDGYSLDNYRRKLDTPSDLQKYEEYRKLDETQQDEMLEVGFQVIPLEKVRENSFNLVGNRYKESKIPTNIFKQVYLYELEQKRIITIEKGKNITRKTTISGNIPVIAGGQNSPYSNNISNYDDETITISASGAYAGYIWYHNYPIWASDCSVIRLINFQKLNLKFLYWVLKGKQQEIYTMQHGTGQPHIYPADIRSIIVPLPPLEIQQQIVEELDNYQNIIDGAKKTINNYFPIIYINPSWQVQKMKEICKIIAGQSPKSEFYNDNNIGLPFYQGNKLFGDMYLKEPQTWTTQNPKIALPGDVLLSVRAPVGEVNICKEQICIGRGLMAIRGSKELNNKFLFFILKLYRHKLKSLSSGSTFEGITKQIVEDVNIPLPSLEEQEQIVAQLEAEQELINANKKLIDIFTKKIQDRINGLFE